MKFNFAGQNPLCFAEKAYIIMLSSYGRWRSLGSAFVWMGRGAVCPFAARPGLSSREEEHKLVNNKAMTVCRGLVTFLFNHFGGEGMDRKKAAVIMGSDSDWPVVEKAVRQLQALEVETEVHVMSAHRTPEAARSFALSARANEIGRAHV